MIKIPRYKVNTLWGWKGFVQDDEKGKFCEYKHYLELYSHCEQVKDERAFFMKEADRLLPYAYTIPTPPPDLDTLRADNDRLNQIVNSLTKKNEALFNAGREIFGIALGSEPNKERVRKLDNWRKAVKINQQLI